MHTHAGGKQDSVGVLSERERERERERATKGAKPHLDQSGCTYTLSLTHMHTYKGGG